MAKHIVGVGFLMCLASQKFRHHRDECTRAATTTFFECSQIIPKRETRLLAHFNTNKVFIAPSLIASDDDDDDGILWSARKLWRIKDENVNELSKPKLLLPICGERLNMQHT